MACRMKRLRRNCAKVALKHQKVNTTYMCEIPTLLSYCFVSFAPQLAVH